MVMKIFELTRGSKSKETNILTKGRSKCEEKLENVFNFLSRNSFSVK